METQRRKGASTMYPGGARRPLLWGATVCILTLLAGCQTTGQQRAGDATGTASGGQDPSEFLVVDCLLPGQIRKLGQSLTYITPRRPVKTSAVDCEIRGGEYVSYDRANYATALNIWLPQAKEGDPAAQTYVGEIYEKGLGIEPDFEFAAQWYAKAAKQGYSRAQINLGYLYEKGLGVKKNQLKALQLYRDASGLQGTDLEFASTVEAQVANRRSEEIKALSDEIVRRRTEADELRAKLSGREQQLARQRAALRRVEQDAGSRRGSSQSQPTTKPAASAEERKLLARREQENRQQQQLITQLEQEIQQQREAMERELAIASQQEQRLEKELGISRQQTASLHEELARAKSQLNQTQRRLGESKRSYQEQLSRLQEREVAQREDLIDREKKIQSFGSIQAQKNALAIQLRQLEEELRTLQRERLETAKRSGLDAAKFQRELDKRQQSINDQQRQISLLKGRLNQYDSLSAQKRALQQEQQALEKEREAWRREQASTTHSEQKKSEALTRLIAKREDELREYQLRIDDLEQQVEQQQAVVASLERKQLPPAVVPGPTIEIIEPPVALTRSRPVVRLRSPTKQREVIGRVVAPAGLVSLSVNDLKQEPENGGLFRAFVPVERPETPVNVVAVDKRGKRAALEFTLIPKAPASRPATVNREAGRKAALGGIDFGKYYALIIGNNEYPNFVNLVTARNDANKIERLLREQYGFKTQLLLDADRYSILSALNTLREKLTEKDNLLIYFAGHGELDRVNLRGHWLPVDAEPDSTVNWISNIQITDILNVMSAKHIMVVADSCYSGSMTRSSLARLQAGMSPEKQRKWMRVMVGARTRTVLTSGGLKPVLDQGGGEHSVFAKAFIEVLRDNQQILEGQALYRALYQRVTGAAARVGFSQTPQYAPIQLAGHEAGEFFFVPKS